MELFFVQFTCHKWGDTVSRGKFRLVKAISSEAAKGKATRWFLKEFKDYVLDKIEVLETIE